MGIPLPLPKLSYAVYTFRKVDLPISRKLFYHIFKQLLKIFTTSSARGFARLFKKIYYVIRQEVCFSGHWQKCVLSHEQLQFAGS